MEVQKKREAEAVFEVMANLAGAIVGTPSIMEDVDDNAPTGHVSKQIKEGINGDGVPIGSPKIVDHAKSTTEDPLGRPEMKWHLLPNSKVSHQSDKLLQQMAFRIGEDARDAKGRRFRN